MREGFWRILKSILIFVIGIDMRDLIKKEIEDLPWDLRIMNDDEVKEKTGVKNVEGWKKEILT